MQKYAPYISTALSFVAVVAYGILTRLAFGLKELSTLFGTLSVAFLVLVSFVLGALTVFFALPKYQKNWLYAAFVPWVPCLIFGGLAAALTWEVWICVVMALPILFVMSSLGGLAMCLLFHLFQKSGAPQISAVIILVLTPYIAAPIEHLFPVRDAARTAHSQIEVNASPEAIWPNIISVPAVGVSEQPFSLFHVAGLPRPLEATLTGNPGVGGTRIGRWEDGLVFNGIFTDWQPNKRYTVRLDPDTRMVQSALPLAGIGGKDFDVTDDSYVIEPLGDGKVILHLYTSYRLTTRLNSYGTVWIDFFMRDIQKHILKIVKARAEASR